MTSRASAPNDDDAAAARDERTHHRPPAGQMPGAVVDSRAPLTASEQRLTTSQAAATPEPPDHPHPGVSRRHVVVTLALIVLALIGLYFLLPKFAGLNQTWGRLRRGDPVWLGVAAGAEFLSIGGYAVLFRTVFGRGATRIDWRVSLQIPLAGIAAIRLFAAAGAGAVAVTAWALGRAGMDARVIACRMVASIVCQYTVYLAAVVIFGFGLGLGLLPGHGPFALTILPAVVALLVAAVVLSAAFLPPDMERRLERITSGPRWWRRLIGRIATAPATLGSGIRTALDLVRARHLGLLGAVAYWAFDIAALGFSFRAFGTHPPVAVLVLGYFLGQLGSLLPLPGGIGGVEGGMIAAFVAFGVPASQAVVGVLAYRAISFWLPTFPGIAGYVALRRTVRRWGKSMRPSTAPPSAAPARTN